MSDWKYGDVLRYRPYGGGKAGRTMFVSRSIPTRVRPDGQVDFWGFQGLELDSSDDGFGRIQALGGHPDIPWGNPENNWQLVEEDS